MRKKPEMKTITVDIPIDQYAECQAIAALMDPVKPKLAQGVRAALAAGVQVIKRRSSQMPVGGVAVVDVQEPAIGQ